MSPSNQSRLTWALRVFLALAFAAAGTAKLAGAAPMVLIFDHIGIGQWFRYVTGVVEIAGVVLLLVPSAGFIGGLLMAATMVCAVATHLLVIGGNPVPAVVLAVVAAIVAYRLRPEAMRARKPEGTGGFAKG
jgi:uncharacterized membrane protein YphA (DoxX/SURF4 family)